VADGLHNERALVGAQVCLLPNPPELPQRNDTHGAVMYVVQYLADVPEMATVVSNSSAKNSTSPSFAGRRS
jgi:hypothetical protein